MNGVNKVYLGGLNNWNIMTLNIIDMNNNDNRYVVFDTILKRIRARISENLFSYIYGEFITDE